jgi:voltage-gated potassium channel
MVMIMGYSIIAVPTGIVTAEMTRVDGPDAPNTRACPNCGVEGHRTDAVHCHACGDSLHASDV